MTFERTHRQYTLWLVALCAILILGSFGWGDDDDDSSDSENAIIIDDDNGADYNPVIVPANFADTIRSPLSSQKQQVVRWNPV